MARRQIRPDAGRLGSDRRASSVHYEAPAAARLDAEMNAFLDWFNGKPTSIPSSRPGIAHLWFVTIHPFDDGNGRIARAIADMALARSEHSPQRFYSMSAQIRQERNAYYDMLEATQKGELDITPWLEWFLRASIARLTGRKTCSPTCFRKAEFWKKHAASRSTTGSATCSIACSTDFEGKLTSSKWAKIEKSSPDTALRDINDLVERGILKKDGAAAGAPATRWPRSDPWAKPRRKMIAQEGSPSKQAAELGALQPLHARNPVFDGAGYV